LVFKILLAGYVLLAFGILVGRVLFNDVANQVIDAEYNAYETRNSTVSITVPG
jgi:hypothetical protein